MNRSITDTNNHDIEISEISYLEGKIAKVNDAKNAYKILIYPTTINDVSKILVIYYPKENEQILINIGDTVAFYGNIKEPRPAENPCCFNYKIYLFGKGIRYSYSCKYYKVLKHDESFFWKIKQGVAITRERFLKQFEDKEKAVIQGIIFGDKSDIDEDVISEFNQNSTGHILAVSGLHIGFLFSLLKKITGKKRNKRTSFFIIFIFCIYGEMTGWNASTIRAIIVFSLSIWHIYALRPFDLLSSVSASALIILSINPYQLFSSGFQLSFFALLGICFLTVPIEHFVGNFFASIIAVQLAITPLLIYYFYGFNPLSIFINIPIVFLASVLVPICIMTLVIMILFSFTPNFLIIIIEELSDLIVNLNKALNFNSAFYKEIVGVSIGVLLIFYIFIFFISSEWFRVRIIRSDHRVIFKYISLLLIPTLAVFIITYNPFKNDQIVFLSVGQGDCTHVNANDIDILIDGGGSDNYNIGEKIIKQYLLKNNTKDIDLALLTHLHQDHYLGIKELNEIYKIKQIGIPMDYSNMNNLPNNHIFIKSNENIRINNEVNIEVVWPLKNNAKKEIEDENELNTVYIVNYGKYKIMLTGDLVEEDEKKMIEHYKGTNKLKCDVIKIGHHGSKTSSSEEFLDTVNPQIAVIQVGINNVYGHPNKQTLDRLKARNIKIYRTDFNGAVGLELKRNKIKVDVMIEEYIK